MPDIAPIPSAVAFVDPKDGTLTEFGRLRWEEVRQLQTQSPIAVDPIAGAGLTAALPVTTLITTLQSGMYRVSVYLRKTVADGVASSLTPTIAFTEHGTTLAQTGAALTVDTTTANQGYVFTVYSDANADIQASVAYASNTPATMTWRYEFRVEYLGA